MIKINSINHNEWERHRKSISYTSQVGVTSVAALRFIGRLKEENAGLMLDYVVTGVSHRGQLPWLTLYLCLGGLKSPWRYIHCWVTVGKLLQTSIHTERHIRLVNRHITSAVGWALMSCLPHSPRQGHTGGWDLCVRPWHSWSSSYQISACTWNRRPPTGTHTEGWRKRNRFFLSPDIPPTSLSSCHPVPTCLVAWWTLLKANRWVWSEMELYLWMEAVRGPLRSSELSGISCGQPKHGARSGTT